MKSKLRRVQQELEERNEVVVELKEILEQSKESCNKLRQENLELIREARSAKALRDEIDILNERLHRLDRLESEIQRYKDRMSEMEFLKCRIEELREDNRLLCESKSMLEEQLEAARKKNERLPELESQVIQLKALSLELESQQEMDREKTACLVDEVNQLRIEKKAAVEELNQSQTELEYLRNQRKVFYCNNGSSNLLEQLNNDASKRLLKLELENQKLSSQLDNIKELGSSSNSPSGGGKSSACSSSSSTSSSSSSCSRMMTASSKRYNNNNILSASDCVSGVNGLDLCYIEESVSEELMLEAEAGRLMILSPEATISEPDSGCVSLVGELNLRLEKMERENCQLRINIQRLNESESRIRELETEKMLCEAELKELKFKLNSESLQAKQVAEQNAEHLAGELRRFQQQIDDLTNRLLEEQERSRELEDENERLQGSVTSLKSIVDRMEEEAASLTTVRHVDPPAAATTSSLLIRSDDDRRLCQETTKSPSTTSLSSSSQLSVDQEVMTAGVHLHRIHYHYPHFHHSLNHSHNHTHSHGHSQVHPHNHHNHLHHAVVPASHARSINSDESSFTVVNESEHPPMQPPGSRNRCVWYEYGCV